MSVYIFGETTDGSSSFSGNSVRARRFLCNKNAEISEVQVYSIGGGYLKVGVYSDNAGEPDTRLSYESTGTLISSGQWNSITVPSFDVSSGTYYWIAGIGNSAGIITYHDSSGGTERYYSIAYASWAAPVTWPTGSDSEGTRQVSHAAFGEITSGSNSFFFSAGF